MTQLCEVCCGLGHHTLMVGWSLREGTMVGEQSSVIRNYMLVVCSDLTN